MKSAFRMSVHTSSRMLGGTRSVDLVIQENIPQIPTVCLRMFSIGMIKHIEPQLLNVSLVLLASRCTPSSATVYIVPT
jgi:hypothetical protein